MKLWMLYESQKKWFLTSTATIKTIIALIVNNTTIITFILMAMGVMLVPMIRIIVRRIKQY